MNDLPTLENITRSFGGVTALAKALGVSRGAIYEWNGVIPDVRAFQIEVRSGGKWKADDIIAFQNRKNSPRVLPPSTPAQL